MEGIRLRGSHIMTLAKHEPKHHQRTKPNPPMTILKKKRRKMNALQKQKVEKMKRVQSIAIHGIGTKNDDASHGQNNEIEHENKIPNDVSATKDNVLNDLKPDDQEPMQTDEIDHANVIPNDDDVLREQKDVLNKELPNVNHEKNQETQPVKGKEHALPTTIDTQIDDAKVLDSNANNKNEEGTTQTTE
eukprot:792455_1